MRPVVHATGDPGVRKADDNVVRAAGGVVLRAAARGGWEVALVHRPRYDDWSLPKGKVDPGETAPACALREVEEETGLTCTLGRFVGQVEFVDTRGRPKVVDYWLMQPGDHTGFAPTDEVDEVRWVTLADARALLTYDHDERLLAAAVTGFRHPTRH